MSDWPKDGVRGVMDPDDLRRHVVGVITEGEPEPGEVLVVIRTAEQDAARSAVIEAAREVLWAFDEAWGYNAHRTMGALRAALEETNEAK